MTTVIEESERKVLRSVRPIDGERMARRSTHLAANHLAVYAGNLEIHGTITAQSGEGPTGATGERA